MHPRNCTETALRCHVSLTLINGCPLGVKTGKAQCEQMFSALPLRADIAQQSRHVRFVPILLQKSFWGGDRKFLEPLMRFTVRREGPYLYIHDGPPDLPRRWIP